MSRWLLGLDLGGGGGRALLANAETGEVASARRSWSHPIAPGTGGIGSDLDLPQMAARLGEASREVLARSGVRPEEVAAVGVSGMRFAFIVQDAKGRVLHAGSNRDGRAAGSAVQLALEEGVEATALRTGHWPASVLMASRLHWLRHTAGDLSRDTSAVLASSDWLLYELTGQIATDTTQASSSGVYDLVAGDWDEVRLEELGIPREWMPAVVASGTPVGELTAAAAEVFGLAAGIPVVAGGGDTQLALLGSGIVAPGAAALVAGTTAPVQIVTEEPARDASVWTECHVVPGRFVVESSAGALGRLVEALAWTMFPDAAFPVARLLAEAGRGRAGAGGMLATISCPVMDAHRLELPIAGLSWTSLLGESDDRRRLNASRAAVEATAFALRANLERLQEVTGQTAELVAAAGGLSASPSWRRIAASVLDTRLQCGPTAESSALGAALCAGVGAGLFEDVSAAAASLRLEATEPDAEEARVYADLAPAWLGVCEARADADRAAAGMALPEVLRAWAAAEKAPAPSRRPRILVTADLDEAGLARLRELGEVEAESYRDSMRLLSGDSLVEALQGFEVLVTEIDVVDAAAFAKLPDLRIVASCRGDAVNVDAEAARAYGVPVLHAPGRNAEAVADISVAFVLMGLRKLSEASAFLRRSHEAGDLGRMGQAHATLRGSELGGATVGLLGLGAVGRRVAQRLHGFGARVLATDPILEPGDAALYDTELVSLDRLLAESDVISLHVPVNDATEGMIDRDALARMKPGAFLVNTARDALVDTVALAEALEEGRLCGAAIDVFAVEPPGSDHPLLALPNVIATPHVGGNTFEVSGHQARIVGDDLERLVRGDRPQNLVNPEVLERFDWNQPRPEPASRELEALADRPPPAVSDLQRAPRPKPAAAAPVSAPREVVEKLERLLGDFVARCTRDERLVAFARERDVTLAFSLPEVDLGFWLRLRGELTGDIGAPEEEPEVELRMSAAVLDGMFSGRVNGMQATMNGELSFVGDAAKAMTMQEIQRDLSRIWGEARTEAGDLGDLESLAEPAQAGVGGAAAPAAAGDVRLEMVRVIDELYAQQVITATGGNVSARIPGKDEIWITPSQLFKGDLRPESLVRLDLEGRALDPGAASASSERLMHCAVFQTRKEAAAVIHAHAPNATILANSDLPFLPISTEAAFFDDLPRIPFVMPGTQDLADAIGEAMRDSWAVLMVNHGLLVAGRSLRRAADMVEIIERSCEIILGCYAVGKEPPVLPDDVVATLRKMGDLVA